MYVLSETVSFPGLTVFFLGFFSFYLCLLETRSFRVKIIQMCLVWDSAKDSGRGNIAG